jgi:hypothetical protein
MGSGPVEAIPKYLALMGTWGGRTYKSSGGRSGDHGPSWQVRTIRPISQRTRVVVGLENPVSTRVDSLSDDFLAG